MLAPADGYLYGKEGDNCLLRSEARNRTEYRTSGVRSRWLDVARALACSGHLELNRHQQRRSRPYGPLRSDRERGELTITKRKVGEFSSNTGPHCVHHLGNRVSK